jgi:hypothetical protein
VFGKQRKTGFMPDRSDEFRRAASDCLRLALNTSDKSTRMALLIMAQRWFDLANGLPTERTFNAALRESNEVQMTPRPVMQQQQQSQPKKDER